MHGFQLNLWCTPWDLAHEGVGAVLDRLRGEAGVTGISVATQYHCVDQLRPHPQVLPRRFRSAGGAQFQPRPGEYAATRLRPVVADWVGKSDPLAAIAEGCRQRGLTLRAWHVCLHSSATVRRYPDAAVHDVFGEPNPAWLCPAHPDVREWLRAMVADLTARYPFEAVELESATFPTDLHAHDHRKEGFPCGAAGDWLRSLCFCASCRQAASREGYDAAAAADAAGRRLEPVFDTGEPIATPIPDLLSQEPALNDYVQARARQVTSLVQAVRSACRCRLVVHRAGDPLWSGADHAAIARHCDALLILYYDRDPGGLERVVAQAAAETGDVQRVELGLSVCTPPCEASATLVGLVRKAVDLGVRCVNLYHQGLIPARRLEWIRQASRYGRRET